MLREWLFLSLLMTGRAARTYLSLGPGSCRWPYGSILASCQTYRRLRTWRDVPCIGLAATVNLLSGEVQFCSQITRDRLSSCLNVDCSIPVQRPEDDAVGLCGLEHGDILQHGTNLMGRIMEIPYTRPNHDHDGSTWDRQSDCFVETHTGRCSAPEREIAA